MRNFFLRAAGFVLTSLTVATVSFSQDYAYHNPFPKTILVSFMANETAAEKTLNTISVDANLKLLKSFNKQFKNASQVEWYHAKKDYLAVFDYEGRRTRALFTKNGYTIYAITYGT